MKEDKEPVPKAGTELDVFNMDKCWVRGVVSAVDGNSLTIKTSLNKMVNSLWPSADLKKCGMKVKTKVCKDKGGNDTSDKLSPINISFQPKSMASLSGWISDGGSVATEQKGLTYGWSSDNTSHAKVSLKSHADSLMATSVSFPPPEDSI